MPASLMLLTSFALVLGLVGCVSGFLAGLLGVGGGIVVVPVLYHVLAAFDVDIALRAHIAVGTSLATIIPTSIQSIRAHRAKGAVDDQLLKLWGAFVAMGVILGVVVAAYAPAALLTAVFGIVAATVALYMLFTQEGWHPVKGLPGRPGQAAMATTIGTISTLMGIGGVGGRAHHRGPRNDRLYHQRLGPSGPAGVLSGIRQRCRLRRDCRDQHVVCSAWGAQGPFDRAAHAPFAVWGFPHRYVRKNAV